VHRLGNLHRQLTRGHKDQPGGLSCVPFFLADPVQHRKCKCRGFSGACGRLAEQILSRDQQRNRFPLNGCRLFIAEGC
jgi:hypothetical protein